MGDVFCLLAITVFFSLFFFCGYVALLFSLMICVQLSSAVPRPDLSAFRVFLSSFLEGFSLLFHWFPL